MPAPYHQHLLHAGGTPIGGQGLIDGWFQGHGLVLAETAVGGDHELGLPIDQPVAQGIGREAAEHHRVGRTDAGAGQHGDRRLGNHRHVEGHQVALANPQGLEGVGRLGHLGVELAVGEAAAVARFPLPDQGRLLGPGPGQVPVEAVVGKVGGAALKPPGEGRVAPVEHGVEGLEPVQLAAGQIPPETVGIGLSLGAEGLISLEGADASRLAARLRRRREQALLLQHRFDR